MFSSSFGFARFLALASLLPHSIDVTASTPGSLDAYLAANPIKAVTGKVPVIDNVPNLVQLNTAREACPASCDEVGLDPRHWTAYHDVNRLSYCNQSMLLDFAVYNPLNSSQTRTTIRCCTAGSAVESVAGLNVPANVTASRIAKRSLLSGLGNCATRGAHTQVEETLQIAFSGSQNSANVGNFRADFQKASQQLANTLSAQESSCNQTLNFAYSGSAVVGLFAGSTLQGQGLAETVLQQFVASVASLGNSESMLVQLCSTGQDRSSRYTLGMIANANADIALVQSAVATWASGGCVTSFDKTESWQTLSLALPVATDEVTAASALTAASASTAASKVKGTTSTKVSTALAPRDTTCTAIKVQSGDTCSSLANECGITPQQFQQYNSEPNECSTLTPGEHVCCTAGTLPNYSPSPYSNGTCYTYLVQTGDSCSSIAATYSITISQLQNFNNNTWGWMGCSDLQAAQNLCLSSGSPPMPAPVQNAVCGPQVPNTPIAPAGTDYTKLNQCPLNACCDIWGQCGTTSEFCTTSQSPTGAPGTAAVGANGCISNCGTQIVTGSAPSSQYAVGYFEAFNTQRPCLNQPVQNVDLSKFTHVHLSFATITSSFQLDISSIQQQFDAFIDLTGNYKKIISVGGWAFCTDPGTYNIFRQAVAPANAATFAANIAQFISQYRLDGIDLDWEYPGEPDIPGIPAGSSSDGPNYASFLQTLQGQMPPGTTVSFTAPASFWYLKAFPVAQMAKYVNYVVYMTYDLHGQWDYGNAFSDPGCPGGNCLRSDVNLTETITALSMITKAGVPANMIAVGVTSYGRSFQMTTAGCYTEQCTYTGPASGAYAGLCTDTNGYISNAEIASLVAGNATLYDLQGNEVAVAAASTYFDQNSYSNIAVYAGTQWVGYMDSSNKAYRANLYKGYNFLGTADWAVDLASYAGDGGAGASGGSVVSVPPSIWNPGTTPSIGCSPPCIFVLPPYPLGYTTTVTWPVMTTTLLSSSANTILTVTTTITVPNFPLSSVPLQPVTLEPTQTGTYQINPVQSITPTSFIFTLGPNLATFPPAQVPTSGASVGGPQPGNNNPNPSTTGTASSSSTAAAIIPFGVTFYTTPHPITIQPQPTISISFPPKSTPIPPVTIQTSAPTPSCSGSGCGSRNCGIFGCGSGCGLFACNGGCGIFGCGGGCGPFGCSGGCALDLCGGLNCVVPGSCGGAEGGGDGTTPGSNPDEPDDSCEEPVTVSSCTYYVSSYSTSPMTAYSTTTTTSCVTQTTCDGENYKTTETINACQTSVAAADAAAVSVLGTTVSGTYIPYDFLPTPGPGQSGAPSGSIFGGAFSYATTNCDACTSLEGIAFQCTEVVGCTKVTTGSSTNTGTQTSTVTANPAPAIKGNCGYWVYFAWYEFEVYNIQGWGGANGASLHHQEDGCGALTGWNWHPSGQYLPSATFNLPFFIKSGCVERAIASAKGPLLSCQFLGYSGSGISGSSFSKRDDEVLDARDEDAESYINYGVYAEYDGILFDYEGDPSDLQSRPEAESYEVRKGQSLRARRAQRRRARAYRKRQAANSTSSAASAQTNTASLQRATFNPSYSYSSSFTKTPLYTPLTWNTSQTGPVTFAWTYNNYTTKYYTSTTVIAKASTIPVPSTAATASSTSSVTSSSSASTPSSTKTSSTSSAPKPTTTSSSVTPPAPTQSGTVSNCSQYYVVKSGDSCSAIESSYSITFQQFYNWNPSIGSNCQYLDVGDAYCVAVPGSTSSTSSTLTPPAPTQSGTASNCTKYYVVKSGDSCSAVESTYNITFQQFYNWNPSIGSNCQYLDVGDAYCVSTS